MIYYDHASHIALDSNRPISSKPSSGWETEKHLAIERINHRKKLPENKADGLLADPRLTEFLKPQRALMLISRFISGQSLFRV